MTTTETSSVSLKQALDLLYQGEFDGKLSRRKLRQTSRLQRRHNRAAFFGREKDFFDELIEGLAGDSRCCSIVSGAVGVASLTSDDFDETIPLGLDSDQLFNFIDALLERLPAIIEAFMSIISMFGAFLLIVAMIPSSTAIAQTTICDGNRCYQIEAPPKVLPRLTIPLRALKERVVNHSPPPTLQSAHSVPPRLECVDCERVALRSVPPIVEFSPITVSSGCGCSCPDCTCAPVITSQVTTFQQPAMATNRPRVFASQPVRRVAGRVGCFLRRLFCR